MTSSPKPRLLDVAYAILEWLEERREIGAPSRSDRPEAKTIAARKARCPGHSEAEWDEAFKPCKRLNDIAWELADRSRDGRRDVWSSLPTLKRRCKGFCEQTYRAALARGLRETVF